MKAYIRERWKSTVRGGYPSRIWGMSVQQVLGQLSEPPRIFNDKNELQARTERIRMHKYLREKLLPPHLMHYNNFSGHIYVEKTPEQCSLNHYHSQRARKDA